MPDGKPAGVRCVNLLEDLSCGVWGQPDRPDVCAGFKPEVWVCGASQGEALANITLLESA